MADFGGFSSGFGGESAMGDQGGFIGSQGPSPESGKKGSKDRQSITPLTIKQLLSAKQLHPDDAHKVDGVEIHQVKVIGNILSIEDSSTFIKYEIEDSTGKLEVKLWKDSNEDAAQPNERVIACRQGVYVRCLGNVRQFQDVVNLVAHDIRPISDHNELTHHMLETIYLHCVNTKGPQQPTQAASAWAAPARVNGGGNLNDSMALEDNSSMSSTQNKVIQFFSMADTDDDDGTGLSIHAVVSGLQKQGISEADVKNAIDFLANEGHLYSTIDDEHFKSTT